MKSNNYCVIMAGGIGSRFWPLSKSHEPKQFLDIMGTGKSFIRATFERFLSTIPVENFLIVTSAAYYDLVLEHIPELKPSQILLEPLRRNTAPCIAYAASRIASQCPEANMVVSPADHLVVNTQEFSRIVEKGLDFVSGNNNLLTIGINPTRPETGYGYIQHHRDDENKEINTVKTFTEKPNKELAEAFLSSGDFLWNSGIFIWSVSAIMNAFEKHLPQIARNFHKGEKLYGTESEQEFINELYPECENISIDYGIMEKSDEVYVAHGDFGWSDIGTWSSLYQNAQNKDAQNNVIQGGSILSYNTSGTIISVPDGKVAVVEGLEDFLIVDRDNILLITRLDNEQNIRNYVDDVKYHFGGEYV